MIWGNMKLVRTNKTYRIDRIERQTPKAYMVHKVELGEIEKTNVLIVNKRTHIRLTDLIGPGSVPHIRMALIGRV